MKKFIAYVLMLTAAYFGTNNLHAADAGLTPRSKSGISYVSGGIGLDQQEAIKKMRDEYNLQLTFADRKSGEFIASVDISIENSAGSTLFEVENMGPLFLAKLTPGTYKIRAQYDDRVQTKSIVLSSKEKLRELYFYW